MSAPAYVPVPVDLSPEVFQRASTRFADFFRELEGAFVERSDLLAQMALALLGREHVLVTGPPGTAKSQIAHAVLGRIIDEKTENPSLFMRQFTESTVQTDLVGPLDFKTLMETGRTEHFTDDGVLGSVHAFLDEVFDGRDMLLRSTLNLLQEREFKHGSRTTRGAVECAVMTSNRYLSEILESSRDTLLAFVDRIGYVNYVPKGFAQQEKLVAVLQREFSATPKRLSCPLTVSDLDVLQAVTEQVVVTEEACKALAMLLDLLEVESAAAAKADPSFIPTRYLSTRTAVRAGRVLRAICVYDKIFFTQDRPLQVLSRDFSLLRLHLVLAGAQIEQARVMLPKQIDARERRQLGILCTEREIFDRCLAKLPQLAEPEKKKRENEAAKVGVAELRNMNLDQLLDLIQKLVPKDLSAPLDLAEGQPISAALSILGERVLEAGTSAKMDATPLDLQGLANRLEYSVPSMRKWVSWLREKSLERLCAAAALPAIDSDAVRLLIANSSPAELEAAADKLLLEMEGHFSLRRYFEKTGLPLSETSAINWAVGLSNIEAVLGLLLDASFRAQTIQVLPAMLKSNGDTNTSELLRELSFPLQRIGYFDKRFVEIGGQPNRIRVAACARQLHPIIQKAFPTQIDPNERHALVDEVEAILLRLREDHLEQVIPASDLVEWTVSALMKPITRNSTQPSGKHDYNGFQTFSGGIGPSIIQTILSVLAVHSWPEISRNEPIPADVVTSLNLIVQQLPERVLEQVGAAELNRVSWLVGYFEEWWRQLTESGSDSTAAEVVTQIEQIVGSGFLRAVREDAALARAKMDLEVLAELIPSVGNRTTALIKRAQTLDEACTTDLVALIGRRANLAWNAVLGRAE